MKDYNNNNNVKDAMLLVVRKDFLLATRVQNKQKYFTLSTDVSGGRLKRVCMVRTHAYMQV